MSHPRRPRNALGILLAAGKRRSGREWPEIDAEARLIKSTREAWINGRVEEPGLAAVIRLASVLEIKPDELVDCVLHGLLPDWIDAGATAAELEQLGGAQGAVADAMRAKASKRGARSRRRPGNGPDRV